ncbi:MAG: enoyl-ACP reductase FabI [Alphaproteobacteria bacterium]
MSDVQPIMAGKRGLIMGVANDRSLAWGIARAAAAHGARLAFTFQGDALEKRVRPLAESVHSELIMPCDVSDDASIDLVFETIGKEWGDLDFVLHAIAFSDKDELKGKYIGTTRGNFIRTLDISCYSLTSVAQRAVRMMPNGGSLLTLTYYGAERVMPHYNVMGVAKAALEASVKYLAADLGTDGIRVNAISAGPVKTLAASGIGDFRYILKWNELNSPLRRNVGLDEVGNAGMYLLSDLSSGVTGEIHHVDCGYNTIGMVAVDAAEEVSELLAGIKGKS